MLRLLYMHTATECGHVECASFRCKVRRSIVNSLGIVGRMCDVGLSPAARCLGPEGAGRFHKTTQHGEQHDIARKRERPVDRQTTCKLFTCHSVIIPGTET
jgi:hypothetical protein